jgi:hypothetical protein
MSAIARLRHLQCMLATQDRQNILSKRKSRENMQDKFAIGPVSIVQLVGLTSKPRIASAQVDVAVRAADVSLPVSAHVGIVQDLQNNVGETTVSYFDIKAPQMLSLTAAPMHASISFEAGVDRAVADSGGPHSGLPQSFFDGLSQNTDLASLLATLRGGAVPVSVPLPPSGGETTPADVPTLPNAGSVPDSSTVAPVDTIAVTDTADSGFIFDGAESFGDDKILNFETYYKDAGLFAAEPHFATGDVHADMVIEMHDFFAADLSMFDFADSSGIPSLELPRFSTHVLEVPQHPDASIDAIPPI